MWAEWLAEPSSRIWSGSVTISVKISNGSLECEVICLLYLPQGVSSNFLNLNELITNWCNYND
jgi:hypothetical protein